MTTTEGLALEITVLTPAEAAAIWKRQTKRAPNFDSYLSFINAHDVGASWNTKVPHGPQNAEHAKEIKHNFSEAAKERTKTVGTGDDATTVPAPVLIRWKANTRKEQHEVVNDKGKKGTAEVVVIDSLDALIIATDAVAKRGPRAVTEEVTPLNPPADAKVGATLTLSDGRKATLSKAGKWRAPKTEAPAASSLTAEGTGASTPSNTDAMGHNGTTVETPAQVGATA